MNNEFDYRQWKTNQWDEWLTLREQVNMGYFDLLKKYINLPARDALIQKELRKMMDPKAYDMVVPGIPPSNAILHTWKQNPVQELDDFELDQGLTGNYFADLETLSQNIPDDARLYEVLAHCEDTFRYLNLFLERWIAFLADSQSSQNANGKIAILGVLSKLLSNLEGCREALFVWMKPKAEAMMLHAMRDLGAFQHLVRDFLVPEQTPPEITQGATQLCKEVEELRKAVEQLPSNPDENERS